MAMVAVAGLAHADQGMMRRAIEELRTARQTLHDAAGDKGGHRERAIELIDKAIDQVEQGITFAEKR
jgi:prefoldin subunit 5